jgi:hypothetical protein
MCFSEFDPNATFDQKSESKKLGRLMIQAEQAMEKELKTRAVD